MRRLCLSFVESWGRHLISGIRRGRESARSLATLGGRSFIPFHPSACIRPKRGKTGWKVILRSGRNTWRAESSCSRGRRIPRSRSLSRFTTRSVIRICVCSPSFCTRRMWAMKWLSRTMCPQTRQNIWANSPKTLWYGAMRRTRDSLETATRRPGRRGVGIWCFWTMTRRWRMAGSALL